MAKTIHRLQSLIRAQAVMTGLKHHSRESRNKNAGLSVFSQKSFVIIFSAAMFLYFFWANIHILFTHKNRYIYKKCASFLENCVETREHLQHMFFIILAFPVRVRCKSFMAHALV